MEVVEYLEQPKEKKEPIARACVSVKDKEGKSHLVEVGAIWENESKAGRKYQTLRLDLLIFPNTKR